MNRERGNELEGSINRKKKKKKRKRKEKERSKGRFRPAWYLHAPAIVAHAVYLSLLLSLSRFCIVLRRIASARKINAPVSLSFARARCSSTETRPDVFRLSLRTRNNNRIVSIERRCEFSYPGYDSSGCLAFTSRETPCGTSTFPACLDCKSRCSPAGPENIANPCCLSSIVSPRASGLRWDFFQRYRDSERGTWATRSRRLCVLRAPTFSGYSRRRAVVQSKFLVFGCLKLSLRSNSVHVGPRTRAARFREPRYR